MPTAGGWPIVADQKLLVILEQQLLSKMTARSKDWCFTLNNYTAEEYEAITHGEYKYLSVGKEVGESGTPHLQGFVQFAVRLRMQTVKSLPGFARAHLEVRRGTPVEAAKYTQKDGDFIEDGTIVTQGARTDLKELHKAMMLGTSHDMMIELFGGKYIRAKRSLDESVTKSKKARTMEKIAEGMMEAKLRYWQEEVLKKLDAQGDRKILFVVDQEGNMGKTWLAKYLMTVRNAFYTNCTVYHDVTYAYQGEPIVVFDIPRSLEMMNYGTIGAIKNGVMFSHKYEAKAKLFHVPKVVVFMNVDPDLSKLSKDVWQIVEIN